MSHFTEVKTKLKCLVTLKKVIEEMGFAFKEGVTTVRGYQGDTTEAIAVIDTKSSYDIGVVQTADGYSLVGDWEMLQVRAGIEQEEFLQTLNKKYAYSKVLEEVSKQGYQVVEEEENEQNVVRVRVRRWT
tara:strand:- start:370 stop:759 length:390 start_codon:yes stop_codon:yes gene_type:complete